MPLSAHVQVLKWRETRNMMAALEGMQDTSEISEACCACLAPCQLPQGMTLCTHVQVLKWRETRNMMAALEGMQDTSEFSEAYCARLADSSAPGCQLVEVFNSHGVFLPQLAGQGGGNKGEPISSRFPTQPTLL